MDLHEGYWYVRSADPIGFEIVDVFRSGTDWFVWRHGSELPFGSGGFEFIGPVQDPSA